MPPRSSDVHPETELSALVSRAQAGDLRAYARLVELTQGPVLAVALHVLKNRAQAEDVAQETFIKAHRALHSIAKRTSVLGWLRRIATNLALSHRRATRVAFVELDEDSSAVDDSREPPPHAALNRALLQLSRDERRLCERFYRGGWSIERLAQAEGVSTLALRKRLSRIRARLREEIVMSETTDTSTPTEQPEQLPDKIVQLLATPTLTDLPENPVGAVWSAVRRSLPDYELVELPEFVSLDQVAAVVGAERMQHQEYHCHQLTGGRILRSDTSMPMLVDTATTPGPCKRIAAGKVYRDEVVVDHRHLQAFHQAEILSVGPTVNEWEVAEWMTELARPLFQNRKLRIEETDFPFMCSRAFELHVLVDDEWIEVAAFGRFHDDIAQRLGGPGARAVGAGLGLERWAQIAYQIDDIRKIEGTTVALAG